MAILAFQKPDKVVMLESTDKFGKFEFRPLEPGFGVTIGNSLRRILLSSLEGYAINTIRIGGVEHEFSSVPGVKEDVTNIILNLKQVRFKQVVEEFENEKVSITVENSTEFKAGDFVQVTDKRAACLEPVSQLSGCIEGEYYISPRDNTTNYYFNRLNKGRHIVSTEYYVDRQGDYHSGTCTAQCTYSPEFGGHTDAYTLNVK